MHSGREHGRMPSAATGTDGEMTVLSQSVRHVCGIHNERYEWSCLQNTHRLRDTEKKVTLPKGRVGRGYTGGLGSQYTQC